MGFYFGALGFVFVTFCCAVMTVVIYLKLLTAVCEEREVPGWIYKLGHTLRGRFGDPYEDITDRQALREATYFLLGVLLANVFFALYRMQKGDNYGAALYAALRKEFFIVLAVRIIWAQGKNLYWFFCRKKRAQYHAYASAAAVWAMTFLTAFSLVLTLSITGVPAPTVSLQIGTTTLTPGKSRGRDFFREGFSIENVTADTEITKPKGAYFGQDYAHTLSRDGKCYGYITLMPDGKKTAAAKDCVLTSLYLKADADGFSDVSIQGKKMAGLTAEDFQREPLTSFFGIQAPDVSEYTRDDEFRIELQNEDYTIFPQYGICGSFAADGTPIYYKVYANATRWE